MQGVTDDSKTACPRGIDTGTFFVDSKYCTYCLKPIVRVDPRPARTDRAWVHVHNSSRYCENRAAAEEDDSR